MPLGFLLCYLAIMQISLYSQSSPDSASAACFPVLTLQQQFHRDIKPLKDSLYTDWSSCETVIKPVEATILGGIYFGSLVALTIHQNNAWWKDQRRSFHFEEDWHSALQIDKFGHTFGTYMISSVSKDAVQEAGVCERDAIWAGGALGLVYQTYTEVQDGYASDWGFSPSDFYFDVVGSLMFMAREYNPAFKIISPKWQYIPSDWLNKPVMNRPKTFIDDYNSTTFWYAVAVYSLLPEKAQQWWPEWLGLAFGYGAEGIDAGHGSDNSYNLLHRRYIIALDVDLEKLLPDGPSLWNWWKRKMNVVKMPLPAIEFSDNKANFYVFYPFNLKIVF